MARFTLSPEQQRAAKSGKAELQRQHDLMRAIDQLRGPVSYAEKASQLLGEDDPFGATAVAARDALRQLLRAPSFDKTAATEVKRTLEALKESYRTLAIERHTRDRLTTAGDRRKQDLINSPTYRDLQVLSSVQLLPSGQFAALQHRLAGIRACPQFTADVFDTDFFCNLCNYQPTLADGTTAEKAVEDAGTQTLSLWQDWTNALRDNLGQPEVSEHIGLLSGAQIAALRPVLDGTLAPGEATLELTQAVEAAFQRMTVRRVSQNELWQAIFPTPAGRSPEELAEAFTAWLAGLADQTQDPSHLRIVPSEGS
jgi:hypothetical protein